MLENKTSIRNKINELVILGDKQRLANDNHNCQKTIDLLMEQSNKYDIKEGLVEAHTLKGLLDVSLSNYASALQHYAIAHKLAFQAGFSPKITIILNNMAQIYFVLNNFDEALKLYNQAIEFDKNNYRAINNIANIYAKREQFEEAETNFKIALKVALKLNRKRSIAICYINLGELANSQNRFEEAINCFDKAFDYLSQVNDPDLVILHKLDYAQVFLKMSDFAKAEKFAHEALILTKNSNDQIILLNCYEVLGRIFAQKEDYKQAYHYSSKQAKLAESIFSDQLQNKITNIHSMYEIQTKEMQLRQMMEHSSKLASIGVMAAGITHEINQPLNAISVSANSILYWNKNNTNNLPKLFIEEVEQISKGSKRIDEIIRHMRDFWITSDGSLCESININRAITDSLSLIENQLRSHGIEIHKQLHEDDIFIKANKINLEQIVLNLMINAMHSLDEKNSPHKAISIITSLEEDSIILEISDNGTGIPENKDIFDPFFSTKAPGKGMGLGLAIVQNIVEKLAGKITAFNNANGATFKIEFPLEG